MRKTLGSMGALLAAVLLLFAGCGSEESPASTASTTPSSTSDEEMGFQIDFSNPAASGETGTAQSGNADPGQPGASGSTTTRSQVQGSRTEQTPVTGVTKLPDPVDKEEYPGRATDLKNKVIRVQSWGTGVTTYSGTGLVAQRAKTLIASIEETLNCTINIVSGHSQYDESVAASLAAGKPSMDIIWLSAGRLVSEVVYNRLVPLDDLQVMDLSDRTRYTIATDLAEFNGKHYAVGPKTYGLYDFGVDTALFCNLDILKSAGVTMEDLQNWVDNKEWTWEKFAEVGAKVKGINQTLILDKMDVGGRFSDFYQALLTSNGTDWVNRTADNSFTFNGSSDEAVAALDFFKSLVDDGYLAFSASSSTPEQDFIAGKSAFLAAPLYSPNYNNAASTYGNFSIMPLPMGPNADTEYSLATSDYTFAAIGRGDKPSGATDAEIATVLDLLQTNLLTEAENDSLILTETIGMAKNSLATNTIQMYSRLYDSGQNGLIWSHLTLNRPNGVNWVQDVYAYAQGSKGKAEILAQESAYNNILGNFYNW